MLFADFLRYGCTDCVSEYTYLEAWSCAVASLMVAYSLMVGGLGDLLWAFPLTDPAAGDPSHAC